jgi:aldehyde:ferredoxin oxidoreductase
MHGWTGKILHVDLSNSRITRFSTQPYAEKYLGGRGIASRLYWEKVTPEVKAFDPENRLIFMTGPLVATGAQGAIRMAVSGKSPMAYPEGYCYGNMGGYFGAELKKAGFDGIVFDGRSPKPMYLLINNNEVELRDASSLWGLGAYRVEEILKQAHGDRVRFVTTGVAGENLVRTAVLFGSHQSTVTGGFGAVLASKNLKAIALKGTGKNPTAADPDRLKELNRYTMKIAKRISLAIPPWIGGTNHGHILETLGKSGCYQCGLECPKYVYRYGKDPNLVGNRRCQAMEYYMPWIYGHEDEPIKTLFDAPTLANDYSIGTFELQSLIDWLYDCYQAGLLTEAETGLPLSKIGTREFLEKLLNAIAHREGFGDILAEGLMRAGEKVPAEARAFFKRTVAPIGQSDINTPRAYMAHALIYPMENRMHPIATHEIVYACLPWRMNQQDPKLSPITPDVFRRIAKLYWGSEAAANVSSYEGKALAARNIQNRTYLKDSLGLCDYVWPITYSLSAPDHIGDPDLEGKIFTAVTGIDADELVHYAERIFNMQRFIMVREGHRVPEDDFPPEFNFTAPLKSIMQGMPMLVPGPGAEPVDVTGNVLDRDKFTDMLKEYYQLRGWDEVTGLPKRETSAALGMDDLATAF